VTRRLLAGLDVGTTAIKAVVFTESGDAVSQGRAAMPWASTATGAHVEPMSLAASAVDALEQALAGAPDGDVVGLGVASMGESGVLLNSSGTPLGPIVAWHDTRDERELASLEAHIDAATFAQTTGLPMRHQWSLTKHRWLLANHPETRGAKRRLNVAEWVVRSLGGEDACERSLASRTGWLRLDTGDWWDESLSWSGAEASLMPTLVDAGTPLGTVSARAGLPRLTGATLTVAGHDHQVAAIGAGALQDGDELDSCGTAEALVRSVPAHLGPEAVEQLVGAGVTVGWHALGGRWSLLGATTGGLTLQRVLSVLGVERRDIPELDRLALLSRSSTVHVIVEGGGNTIAGIRDAVGPADVWRAALEHVTSEIGDIHDAMSALSGPHRALVVTGGWSHSSGLMTLKRRRFGPLQVSSVSETGALGAALLAGLASGTFGDTTQFPAQRHGPRTVR
jgi:sugar (pentulose or hexulose) kinase